VTKQLHTKRAKTSQDGGYDWAIIDQEGQILAECFEVTGTGIRQPAKANASLFAAAPELLASLKAVTQIMRENGYVPPCQITRDAAMLISRLEDNVN